MVINDVIEMEWIYSNVYANDTTALGNAKIACKAKINWLTIYNVKDMPITKNKR